MINLYKKFIILLIIFLLNNCSFLSNIINVRNINQGNYINDLDIKNIHNGMDKNSIVKLLGNPVLKNIFNKKKWYYIMYERLGDKVINHKNIILYFNKFNKLEKFEINIISK